MASWRTLAETDLTALTRLAADCLAADGGQPHAAEPDFLRGLFSFPERTKWRLWNPAPNSSASFTLLVWSSIFRVTFVH
jgi:hypothetical protein